MAAGDSTAGIFHEALEAVRRTNISHMSALDALERAFTTETVRFYKHQQQSEIFENTLYSMNAAGSAGESCKRSTSGPRRA